MTIYRNPESPLSLPYPVVTVGSFDGMHIGHRTITDRLCSIARSERGTATLVTLYPHPRKVLGLDTEGFFTLSSLEEKERLLEDAGVEALVEIEFTSAVGMMGSEEFVRRILHETIGARHVIVGYDHHFGHDRRGDFSSLSALGRELGFEVTQMSRQDAEGEKVSSTTVRNALMCGDMDTAVRYLGHPYLFVGEVRDGVLSVNDDMKLMPPAGRYLAECDGKDTAVAVSGRAIECHGIPDGRCAIGIKSTIPSV